MLDGWIESLMVFKWRKKVSQRTESEEMGKSTDGFSKCKCMRCDCFQGNYFF